MPIREEAEENLRVIRSLMERATIYRAVSAEAALVGGLLALAGAGVLALKFSAGAFLAETSKTFFVVWTLVLALAALGNAAFLRRAADRRGEPFFSSGMKMALVAMAPGLLCGLVLSLIFLIRSYAVLLPPVWMLCYGTALLATRHFAPRSLVLLGWSFLLAGLGIFVWWAFPRTLDAGTAAANSFLLMAATFGGFHLIYAACAWPRHHRENAGATP